MVEINNVRRSSICWRGRRTDNGRQKTEIMVMTSIAEDESCFAWLSDHPHWTVTLNPKLKSTGAGRYQLLSLVGCLPQAASADFSPKSQDAVALQQIKGVFPMIDRGDIRRGNRPLQQYLGFCRALVMVSSSIRLTAWLQNSKKRAERSERLTDVWAESPRLSPIWLLSASSSACHGLLIITVITPLPTKPSATKMPENWSWRTQQCGVRCVSVVLLRSMQNTRRVSWC